MVACIIEQSITQITSTKGKIYGWKLLAALKEVAKSCSAPLLQHAQ